jgi:hypothetical protein
MRELQRTTRPCSLESRRLNSRCHMRARQTVGHVGKLGPSILRRLTTDGKGQCGAPDRRERPATDSMPEIAAAATFGLAPLAGQWAAKPGTFILSSMYALVIAWALSFGIPEKNLTRAWGTINALA